jgi:hypothetical protein
MNSCLAQLDGLCGWEDDLEVEELSSIQSATLVIIIVVGATPLPSTALTTVAPPM